MPFVTARTPLSGPGDFGPGTAWWVMSSPTTDRLGTVRVSGCASDANAEKEHLCA
jgi:hypothetical protein